MVQYKVDDMTCGGCAARITRALKELDAQARIDIDRGQRLVRVDSTARPADLEAAIRDAGYSPLRSE